MHNVTAVSTPQNINCNSFERKVHLKTQRRRENKSKLKVQKACRRQSFKNEFCISTICSETFGHLTLEIHKTMWKRKIAKYIQTIHTHFHN